MKSLHLATIAVCAFAAVALAQQPDPVGSWKAVFVGPMGDRPIVPDAITFDLQRTERGLAGTVHAGSWPGDAEISDAKFEGDHVSFTAVTTRGWSASLPGQGRVEHCCPKLIFDGRIHGDQMTLVLTWSSTEVSDGSGNKLPMEAKRASR